MGTPVISVLVLQNEMNLLRGEVDSLSETCVTSAQVERVGALTEKDEQEQTTTPVIKTEPKVSCVCGDCMHQIDILLISETHFTAKTHFVLPGYDLYFTNHPDGAAHGGPAIIVKQPWHTMKN